MIIRFEGNYFIGLMSGSSLDAIDALCVKFAENRCQPIAHYSLAMPAPLKKNLMALTTPQTNELASSCQLDSQLGELFAVAVNDLLAQHTIAREQVIAIGSHGQTLRHQPQSRQPYSLQIADPNIIAEKTGITTVADFRRRDIACGGQGAPLACGLHAALWHSSQENRVVLNIGGIANITYLPKNDDVDGVLGFDTGPGNTLLDYVARQYLQQPYDDQGQLARQGRVNEALLDRLLDDDFFAQPPPKSSGTDYFNADWLTQKMRGFALEAADLQATLTELTAVSISRALSALEHGVEAICIGGGGAYNRFLWQRLAAHNPGVTLLDSEAAFGLAPRWVEAAAFAWLARQTLMQKAGNVKSVTGASKACVLGGIYLA